MEAFAFLCGILAAYGYQYYAVIFSLLFCLLFSWRVYIIIFLAGWIYAVLHLAWFSASGMPEIPVLRHAYIHGKIISLVEHKGEALQFLVRIMHYEGHKVRATALLRCYKNCPELQSGQHIEVYVKLKKPRNFHNPGAFNYEEYMRARHIDWVGYTRGKILIIRSLTSAKTKIDNLRTLLSSHLDYSGLSDKAKAIATALSLGIGHKISLEDWLLFRRTGTTHLMVISGAHISLVAGLIFSFGLFFWKRLPNASLWIPAQRCAAIFAIFAAIFYALLAGGAIPAQRAVIGCALFFSRYLIAKPISRWQGWRYAMMLVLIIEPHAALLRGFYLSFLSVAVLMLAYQRYQGSRFKKVLISQLICLAGLIPVSLYCFGYGAINSFFANLIAIPFVGFVLIPLSLLIIITNGLFEPVSSALLNVSTELLYYYLHIVDCLSFINITKAALTFSFPVICLSALFIGAFLPKRHLIFPLSLTFLSILNPRIISVPEREATMDVLDVGQGLAVLIRTQHHSLLYDTGGKYYKGPDMGTLAILPYLQASGIQVLDKMIISHPDLDHRGGMESIEKNINVRELIVDSPEFYQRGSNCHSYSTWQWDGVNFEFLSMDVPLQPRNNHSCVLRVYNKSGQWLLAGDIEKESEEWLLKHYPHKLPSSVLLVPHHGSKTSSSLKFLKAVRPQVAIISAGFDNRFRFPHQQTLKHYTQIGSIIKITSENGLIHEILKE